MIVKAICESCGETIGLLRVHDSDDSGWGRVILCREQQLTLREALRDHSGKRCAYIAGLQQESLDKLLD